MLFVGEFQVNPSKGELLKDDGNATVNDSGVRQQRKPKKDAPRDRKVNGEGSPHPKALNGPDEHEKLSPAKTKFPPELKDSIKGLNPEMMALVSASSWSGVLPPPDAFNQYDKTVQDKLVEWADIQIKATCTDQSARQDLITAAEIRVKYIGAVSSVVLFFLSLVGAVIAVAITKNPMAASWFVGLQLTTIAVNVVVTIVNTRKSGKKEKSESGISHPEEE